MIYLQCLAILLHYDTSRFEKFVGAYSGRLPKGMNRSKLYDSMSNFVLTASIAVSI